MFYFPQELKPVELVTRLDLCNYTLRTIYVVASTPVGIAESRK